MRRGDIWWAELPPPTGRRPVVLLSRDEAYAIRALVTVAPVTTRIRQIPAEVPLGPEDGLPPAVCREPGYDPHHCQGQPARASRNAQRGEDRGGGGGDPLRAGHGIRGPQWIRSRAQPSLTPLPVLQPMISLVWLTPYLALMQPPMA